MKKYFVSSDIHSFFSEFKKALDTAGFDSENPEHILIICGDLFDRGSESTELLEFLLKLDSKERFIFIRGNHEDLLEKLVYKNRCSPAYYDFSNGTVGTISDLTNIDFIECHPDDVIERLKEIGLTKLFSHAIDFYETKNHIFVHGWIPPANSFTDKIIYDPKWRKATKSRWEDARWINGMYYAHNGILEPNKTIVCGHWHASYGNIRKEKGWDSFSDRYFKPLEFSDNELFKPYEDKGILALDACTAHTFFCNVVTFTEEEI